MSKRPAKRTSVPKAGARKPVGKAKSKFEGIKVKTPPFAISFPNVFEPKENEFGQERFSAVAVFTPTEAHWKALAKQFVAPEARAEMVEQWKTEWDAIKSAFRKIAVRDFGCDPKTWRADMREQERRVVLRDGNKPKLGQVGYGPDTWFFNMSSASQPDIIDRAGNDIGPDEGNTKEIYPGAICRASVTISAYNQGGGSGITVFLNNIQKLADGPRLDNRTRAKDDFNDDSDSKWLDDDGDEGGDEDEADDEADDDNEFEDEGDED